MWQSAQAPPGPSPHEEAIFSWVKGQGRLRWRPRFQWWCLRVRWLHGHNRYAHVIFPVQVTKVTRLVTQLIKLIKLIKMIKLIVV